MSEAPDNTKYSTACAECQENPSEGLRTFDGREICRSCADLYYIVCAFCLYRVPREEVMMKDELASCPACSSTQGDQLSEDDVQELIANFVRLHAEEKKIKDQLEEIKERLKQHAASQPRIANAVVLRSGDAAIKVGYSTRLSYDAEQLAQAEGLLGETAFARLFEREVKFNPIKEQLEEFLASENPAEAEARKAIQAAQQTKEVATITPTVSKSTSRKSAKN